MRSPQQLQPTGVGIYLRDIADAAEGRELAARIAGHGLSFAALMGLWQDARGTVDKVARSAERACADELHRRGVDVWVWGYPDVGREPAFVSGMLEHVRALGGQGVLLDPEKPYKGKPDAIATLLELTIDALDESMGLGVTSFGSLQAHRLTALAGHGWGSPQVYTVEPWRARRSIEEWRALGWTHVVPSIPTYGPQSEGSLGAYLGALEDVSDGFIAWSEPSTSPVEWKTLERWAARLEGRQRAA